MVVKGKSKPKTTTDQVEEDDVFMWQARTSSLVELAGSSSPFRFLNLDPSSCHSPRFVDLNFVEEGATLFDNNFNPSTPQSTLQDEQVVEQISISV